MARILNVKDEAVTTGVLDKQVTVLHDHREITFIGNDGVAHTIYVHKNGPFADPERAIEAHEQGTLHPDEGDADKVEPSAAPQGEVFE